jgi:hypothetical protein
MPEYDYKNMVDERFVLGGFGALGNPSSFHIPSTRDVREWALYAVISKIFKNSKYFKGYKIEKLFDRIIYRPSYYKNPTRVGNNKKGEKVRAGKLGKKTPLKPMAESWHRDESVFASKDDLTFGGWLNISKGISTFSCCPKTHKNVSGHRGFATIKKDTREFKMAEKNKVKVIIPEGHLLIFYEQLVHEVYPGHLNYKVIRYHTGFRLTKSNKPMTPNLEFIIENQGVPPLKSGQIPPIFGANHQAAFMYLVQWFSKRFIRKVKNNYTIKKSKYDHETGRTYCIVDRYMKSLKEYKLPLYKSYNKYEKNIFYPSKKFYLKYPGKEKRININL